MVCTQNCLTAVASTGILILVLQHDLYFILDMDMKAYVPSPPQMIGRQFQRAKPNLGRAQSRKEASDVEEDRAEQRKAKPEDSLSQHEGSGNSFFKK